MSAAGLLLFTITAMPSVAMVTAVRPSASSLSFTARDAMPMSLMPLIASDMPVDESLCVTAMSASGLMAS